MKAHKCVFFFFPGVISDSGPGEMLLASSADLLWQDIKDQRQHKEQERASIECGPLRRGLIISPGAAVPRPLRDDTDGYVRR